MAMDVLNAVGLVFLLTIRCENSARRSALLRTMMGVNMCAAVSPATAHVVVIIVVLAGWPRMRGVVCALHRTAKLFTAKLSLRD